MFTYIPEAAIKHSVPNSLTDIQKQTLLNILQGFLSNTISYEQAFHQSMEICGSGEPIKFAQDVLNTRNDAIPQQVFKIDKTTLRKEYGGNWTPYEDKRLLMAVEMYKPINWAKIASYVGSRNKFQCSQRWERTLDPSISKEPWTQEENEALIDAVQKYGQKSWQEVAKHVGNRTDVQCRYRYKYSLSQSTIRKVQKHLKNDKVEPPVKQVSFDEPQKSETKDDPLKFFDKLNIDDFMMKGGDFF